MAILKIARMGHPVLNRPADPVEDPSAPELHRLVEDMIETMEDAGGTGLAAPQVHVPLRVVVFFIGAARARREATSADPEAAEPVAGVPLTVLINPEVEPIGDETALGWEACLSVPGLAGEVPRYTAVRYRGTGLEGEPIAREATGFHARVVQHECDHLDGVVYPQRMTDLSRLVFTSEMRHLAEDEAREE
jgi:peptide deformylase